MSSSEIQNKILKLTEELIQHQSIASNIDAQKACLQSIANEFESVFEVREYILNGNPALVLTNASGNESDIIISGHIDVVDGDVSLFNPVIKDGVLYGRGAYDMKGPLAAALFAARDALAQGADKTITFLITADEEVSGDGTKALLAQEGYTARQVIIPDGGNEASVVTAQKGFVQFVLVLKGSSAHASRPWKGENPISQVSELIQKILQKYPVPTSENDWKTTVTPTKLEAGVALNQIPDTATLYVDMRYILEADKEAFIAWFESEYTDAGFLTIVEENGMFFVDEQDPLVVQLTLSIQEITGVQPTTVRECGTSDAIFFTEHGIPAVLYRPNGGGEHGDNERVDLESLTMLYEVLVSYLVTPSR